MSDVTSATDNRKVNRLFRTLLPYCFFRFSLLYFIYMCVCVLKYVFSGNVLLFVCRVATKYNCHQSNGDRYALGGDWPWSGQDGDNNAVFVCTIGGAVRLEMYREEQVEPGDYRWVVLWYIASYNEMEKLTSIDVFTESYWVQCY